MQQHSDDGYLLQPLAAGLLAVLLVLAGVVEPRPQRRQQLLRQRAQGARRRLAEDHISPQLKRRVCCRGVQVGEGGGGIGGLRHFYFSW